jgi:hypothetical protein
MPFRMNMGKDAGGQIQILVAFGLIFLPLKRERNLPAPVSEIYVETRRFYGYPK